MPLAMPLAMPWSMPLAMPWFDPFGDGFVVDGGVHALQLLACGLDEYIAKWRVGLEGADDVGPQGLDVVDAERGHHSLEQRRERRDPLAGDLLAVIGEPEQRPSDLDEGERTVASMLIGKDSLAEFVDLEP